MPETKGRLLIVDDEPLIRMSLTETLTEVGYAVRSAEDGLSALAEIRREFPEILISDLNMPGMSGFELLPVIRQRFPGIRVIAMSGTYYGDEALSGVAADAFFQKGCSLGALVKIVESLPWPERKTSTPPAPAPVWIARNHRNTSGEACVTIECPECLRSFPQVLEDTIGSTCETDCISCGALVRYAIVQPAELSTFKHRQSSAKPKHRFMRKQELKAASSGR